MDDRPGVRIVDQVLGREATYTLADLAERAGVELEDLRVTRAAFGLPAPVGERIFGEPDLEAARSLRALLDAGVPVPLVVEIDRVIGRALAQVAAASRALVLSAAPDLSEEQLAALVAQLTPLMEPVLGFVWAEHVRQLVRSELAAATDLGARPVTVAFADLVGFTRLGEERPPEDLGRVAARLEAVAAEHVAPPVQVVKTIGDAIMLVAPTPPPLLDVALTLAELEDPELPQLRVGVACGPALARAGDWYGRPVNLAARLTDLARPASVVATEEVRDAAPELHWSALRPRKVRGVGEVRLFRARRPGAGAAG